MPNEKTRADSVRAYLTGAASNGGAQTDPALSLGNYRSSTLLTFLENVITSAIANVTVNHVSGANGEGVGTITAVSVNSLTWTPPGGTAGAAVTIANGETKILEGAGAPGKFVRVIRTSATDLAGAATCTLTYKANDLVGFDDVSAAEAAAGDVEYRALMLMNEAAATVKNVTVYLSLLGTSQASGAAQLGASGAGTITVSVGNFNDWPDSGYCRIESSVGTLREIVYYESRTSTSLTVPANGRGLLGTAAAAGSASDIIKAVPGIRIASEAPVSNAIQTIADENTSPTGRTWVTPVSKATGLVIGNMAAAAMYGLWVEREVPVGATSEASVLQSIAVAFDAA